MDSRCWRETAVEKSRQHIFKRVSILKEDWGTAGQTCSSVRGEVGSGGGKREDNKRKKCKPGNILEFLSKARMGEVNEAVSKRTKCMVAVFPPFSAPFLSLSLFHFFSFHLSSFPFPSLLSYCLSGRNSWVMVKGRKHLREEGKAKGNVELSRARRIQV